MQIKKIKKWWWLVVVGGVLILMIIALSSGQKMEQNNSITPTPSVSSTTPTPPPAAIEGVGPNINQDAKVIAQQNKEIEQNKLDYPLADKLPYKTNDFVIDHYRYAKTLVVIIYDENKKSEIEKMINNWLIDNGSTVNSHKIIWTVQKQK
ncbi:MAG: hypothetical protein WC784_01350 [Candidatus Shapirobacteria bacterium]|jgi:hypothetical protein